MQNFNDNIGKRYQNGQFTFKMLLVILFFFFFTLLVQSCQSSSYIRKNNLIIQTETYTIYNEVQNLHKPKISQSVLKFPSVCGHKTPITPCVELELSECHVISRVQHTD